MGIWRRILDAILGYDVVSVEKAQEIAANAIKSCDLDGNGYLNAGELVRTIKQSIKGLT